MSAESLPDEHFTAADGGPGTPFTCLLCGAVFTHARRVCATCPLAPRCDVVACPRCGYQFPRTSRLAEALQGLMARMRRRA